MLGRHELVPLADGRHPRNRKEGLEIVRLVQLSGPSEAAPMGGVVHMFDLSRFARRNQWSGALQRDLCLTAQLLSEQPQSQKQEPEELMEEVSVEQGVPDPWTVQGEEGQSPSVRYPVEFPSRLDRRRSMLFGPGPRGAGLASGPE